MIYKLKKELLIFAMALIFGILLASPINAKADDNTVSFTDAAGSVGTITNNRNGTVTINYTNTTTLRIKILVDADNYRQQYDYNGNSITVPLTAGNVEYNVRVMRNVEGSRYSTIGSLKFTLNLADKNRVYLHSNAIVNYKISDNALRRAAELTEGCKSEREVVEAIHKYVVENYQYNYDLAAKITEGSVTTYIPDIQKVYSSRKGICYDYAVTMAAMLRSRGIEVRVVTGVPDPSMVNGYHAWNQIYDSASKSWYTIDVTYDSCYFNKGYSYKLYKDEGLYSNITYIY